MSLANLEERIAQLEAASESIREATREAHEAIQTLQLLRRDVQELLGSDVRALVAEALHDQIDISLATVRATVREANERVSFEIGAKYRLFIRQLDDAHELGRELRKMAELLNRSELRLR